MKTILILLAFCTFNVFAAPVNVNTGDAESIAKSLNGIGLKKAKAIVEDREKNGYFKSVDDLTRVKGIGAKTVLKNKTDILITIPAKGK